MKEQKEFYMSAKQQEIFFCGARDQRVVASRRFGKTDGVIGPHFLRVIQSMARGVGMFVGNSRRQLMARTMPGVLSAIARRGWIEGRHYWMGKPPQRLVQKGLIQSPIIKPDSWDMTLNFYNGFCWHLLSTEIKSSGNGISAVFCIGDEARFFRKEVLDASIMPALSGMTHPLGDPAFSEYNPWYKGTLFTSDASLSVRQNWLEREEAKCDIVIEEGEFKGMTHRQLQAELEQYAHSVMRYNELLRTAKKTGHKVRVVSPERKLYLYELAKKVKAREGKFKICSNPVVNKMNCEMLVNYHVISSEDAEELFDYEYLLTPEEEFELMVLQKSQEYNDKIRRMRGTAFCFYRANILDAVDLIGIDYINRMRRDLPPAIFQLSMLNLPKVKSNDGFYSLLDIENVHGYIPQMPDATLDKTIRIKTSSVIHAGQEERDEYESYDFGLLEKIEDCSVDGDVDDSDLYIALDYNANINWIVTGKVGENDMGGECLYVLSSMFVKNELKLEDLMKKWCKYYAPHKKRNSHVHYFYDATAKFRAYASEQQTDFKDIVIAVLKRNGWNVTTSDLGTPMQHEAKYKDINEGLSESGRLSIRFNIERNEYLIPALEHAEVRRAYNGWHKNKLGEKIGETEENPLEGALRTDSTDAFDTLYIGCLYYRRPMGFMFMPRIG